jgi:hypothetical protein
MNWLKKGPELKLSELKVPDFLYDLFYDLKDRHLLPLVAVLIVAIIGAPIYFKSSTKSDPEPAATRGGSAATASSVAGGGGETLVVARSEPGLRSYKQRLKKYRELDPFEQRGEGESTTATETAAGEGTTSTVAPAEATVVGEETGVSEAPVESTPYSPESFESGATESGSTGSEGGKTRTRYASDAIDVRIVTVPPHSTEEKRAKKATPKAEVRRNLPELTMLPDRQTPAATYIGLSNDGKKALFVVSSDVVSLFGEGQCVIGSQTCQLLALEPGLPETFVYGPQERTYRIALLKINKTYSAKPRRATLGATEGKHGSHGGSEGEGGGAGTGPTGSEPAERGSNG